MPILINTLVRRVKCMMSWCILALCCLGLSSTSLYGQTRFHPYDTTAAVSRYRSVEECLQAVDRVSDDARRARPEFPDTMFFTIVDGRDSTAVSAVAIARQCSEKFHPDSVVLTGVVETYTDWMQLYLIANRDDAATVVAQRRIVMAQQQPKSPRELYDVLMAVTGTYGAVRPMRWDKVQATVAQLQAQGVAPGPVELHKVYASLFWFAYTVGDTMVQKHTAERMLALGETMSPEIKSRRPYGTVRYWNSVAINFLTRAVRMDSLRRGPEAYVAISRANWKRAMDGTDAPNPMVIGEKAPPVTAEFWFTSDTAAAASTSDRPRPFLGSVALVVFLRQGCHASRPSANSYGLGRSVYPADCWAIYSSLRRLGQRFPGLEITLVTRTAGYMGTAGPVSPRDEALGLQKWWLGFHRLPVTLAVATTQFFRLEGGDRRRIDEPVPNDVNYLFGRAGHGGHRNEVDTHMAYLIDTNGMVIHSGHLRASGEEIMTEMLEVIGQRRK